MKLQEPKNPNYAAVVVRLSKFVDLPNCDNVKAALIFGNSVIVGKDSKEGDLGLFFPVETQLSAEFLGANNLFRHPEWGNVDQTKKGYFEQHGRIKAVKFRGHKSEGFFIPIDSLYYLNNEPSNVYLVEGQTFDAIDDHEICRKYIPKRNPSGQSKEQVKRAKLEDSIVPNQFRLHYDTENLRRNYQKINPDDWISITDKWHGTSVVISNLLVKRDLNWFEKALKFLGVKVQDSKYGIIYSSRRVIKGVDEKVKSTLDYYGEGVLHQNWEESGIWRVVSQEVTDILPKGYTIYGEIVGFTPNGKAIQPGYHYGCMPKGHKLMVYRVTNTNADGQPIELSWPQLKEFCAKYGLEHVKELWYGQAKDFDDVALYYLYNRDSRDWQEALLESLEKHFITEGMCPHNNNEVPAEGIVVRIDHLNQSEAYKLKNFKFLEWESKQLDKADYTDIEEQNDSELSEQEGTL